MAVSVYPLAKDCLKGQKLPANISPDEWDSFHDLIIIDEIARCGYLGVIWGLACMWQRSTFGIALLGLIIFCYRWQ